MQAESKIMFDFDKMKRQDLKNTEPESSGQSSCKNIVKMIKLSRSNSLISIGKKNRSSRTEVLQK